MKRTGFTVKRLIIGLAILSIPAVGLAGAAPAAHADVLPTLYSYGYHSEIDVQASGFTPGGVVDIYANERNAFTDDPWTLVARTQTTACGASFCDGIFGISGPDQIGLGDFEVSLSSQPVDPCAAAFGGNQLLVWAYDETMGLWASGSGSVVCMN